MRKRILLSLVLLAAGATSSSLAADPDGIYIVGGGVGVVPCTQFLNAMAEARQAGGLTTLAGADLVSHWSYYVLGFQTGYNFGTPGVKDIFSAFGPSPSNDVLYAIEPWCQRNPTEKFGDALVVFAESLRAIQNVPILGK